MNTDGERAVLANAEVGELGGLVPQTFEQMKEFCDMLASGNMVPKAYQDKPGDIFAALQLGAQLGLNPMAALQSIASVNGQPALWGDGMLAVCQSHPEWGGMQEECDGKVAACQVVRHVRGQRQETVRTFSLEDATRAGLIQRAQEKGGPWKDYPQRMLQMRARAWALRDTFADALKGIKCAEEARDQRAIEVEATNVEPETGVAGLKALLAKAPKPEGPSLDRILADVDDVNDLQAFEAIDWKGKTGALTAGEKRELRKRLDERHAQLKEAYETGADPQTGEVPQ